MSYANYKVVGQVGVVTLNRPERLNAIGTQLLEDLHVALQRAQSDRATSAIVLHGAGRAFCAGDDLKDFAEQAKDLESIASHVERIQRITRDLMFGEKPVIGAIHGFAVGGGFEWLLNCDLVIATEDLVCFFPEMDWGQFVTGGVTYLLPMAVGYQKAMELWLLGERQSSDTLQKLGIVNWIVSKDQLLTKAMSVAEAVSTKSAMSVGRLKKLLTTQLQGQLANSLVLEHRATVDCFGSPDAAERVKKFGKN
ncbi:enoyl-CoA hydratase/isomerase family protein [Noviherbaspirillum saxi]|uniref:Enoyl-CoA hydratase/isomerase family protein n=1 Tax=Noviherbaspirillum saxi TaxID=2320863 RepID=A0A3A3FJ50_9BURK|nr:enoyl-CoA hydratase/isomerase family protein [Noviherbaspirillum saxi]RJF95518.1 enoyl-CoA hydratase/isomerase family protein [Noviherbaspirillum saxi]